MSAIFLLINAASIFPSGPTTQARRTLDFYFIDSEGGASTLIVTPAGESVLIDAGWADVGGRDAKRVQQAMQQAGITAIDHLVATHYHQDHYGGVPDLSRSVTVRRFYDHGEMASMTEDPKFAERYGAYRAAAKNQTTTLKPGDAIQLKAAAGTPPLKILCVAAGGEVISGKQSSANPECGSNTPQEDASENGRSVALLLSWGGFEFLNLADLTFNISQRLVCPVNQIGEIDLYQVTHHGGNVNNNALLLRSVRPSVSVMVNGPRKGGHPDTIVWLQKNPLFKALYQLHRNVQIPAEQNVAAEFIANLDEQPDAGYMITVSVDAAKRAYTVTNGRTKESKSFPFK
jgi:beta-lactamase superfamily II metal-dependent hydrolase